MKINWPFVTRARHEKLRQAYLEQRKQTSHWINETLKKSQKAGYFEKLYIAASKNDKRDPKTGRYTKSPT